MEYLNNILGNNFEDKTAFINFFPPQAYNFLIFQRNRKNNICNTFTYEDINYLKRNIERYKNIIISSNNKDMYNEFTNWLLQNNFKYIDVINIFNHTEAKTFLYKAE